MVDTKVDNFFDTLQLGSWIQIGHPVVAEIMAMSGFDWLAIDLEHSAITIREAEDLIRIIELNDVRPFVRLASNNPEQIKRVMDSGAHHVGIPKASTRCTVLCKQSVIVAGGNSYLPRLRTKVTHAGMANPRPTAVTRACQPPHSVLPPTKVRVSRLADIF